ncbi:MAG: Hsp20/alpha crystallin family protein [Rhodospirillaceae bacterium]
MSLPSLKDIVPRWWGKREVESSSEGSNVQVRNQDGDLYPFQTLHKEIDRAFESFWRSMEVSPFGGGVALPGLGAYPRTEVSETNKAVEVSFDLPGLNDKDLSVSVANGLLTVKAERKSENENKSAGIHVSERHYGLIQRTVPLPPGTDADNATASYKNGVLTVSVPKVSLPEQEVKRISVRKSWIASQDVV